MTETDRIKGRDRGKNVYRGIKGGRYGDRDRDKGRNRTAAGTGRRE